MAISYMPGSLLVVPVQVCEGKVIVYSGIRNINTAFIAWINKIMSSFPVVVTEKPCVTVI